MNIPFYYVDKPQGSNNHFVYSTINEVNPHAYFGGKGRGIKRSIIQLEMGI